MQHRLTPILCGKVWSSITLSLRYYHYLIFIFWILVKSSYTHMTISYDFLPYMLDYSSHSTDKRKGKIYFPSHSFQFESHVNSHYEIHVDSQCLGELFLVNAQKMLHKKIHMLATNFLEVQWSNTNYKVVLVEDIMIEAIPICFDTSPNKKSIQGRKSHGIYMVSRRHRNF